MLFVTKLVAVATMVVALGPASPKRIPPASPDAVALREILNAQPDYVADVVYDGNDPIPSRVGWVSRVSKRGEEYRVELESVRREGPPVDLRHESIVVDRSGKRFALEHDAHEYFELSERNWARLCFIALGLNVAETKAFTSEVGPSTNRTGSIQIDGHWCDVYHTAACTSGSYVVYVAQELKGLVLRMDFKPDESTSIRNLFILKNAVVDPLDLTDDSFEVPTAYTQVTESKGGR